MLKLKQSFARAPHVDANAWLLITQGQGHSEVKVTRKYGMSEVLPKGGM